LYNASTKALHIAKLTKNACSNTQAQSDDLCLPTTLNLHKLCMIALLILCSWTAVYISTFKAECCN